LREVLVGEVGVLGQQARGDVVVAVLAVQQEQVAEGLGGIRGIGQQVGQLLERGCRVVLAENDRLNGYEGMRIGVVGNFPL
jgi:hypothetical protein